MFWKSVSWPFKVNAAVAGIGINPASIDGQTRSELQTLGREAGLTAEETALVVVSLVAGIGAPTELEHIVSVWHRERKVDLEKPEVIDAMYETGCPVGDPRWEYDAIGIFNGTMDDERMNEIDQYAKSPIAQLFARARHDKMQAALKRTAGSESLP